MVMMVDLDKLSVPFTDLKTQLDRKGDQMGLSIRVQRGDLPGHAPHLRRERLVFSA